MGHLGHTIRWWCLFSFFDPRQGQRHVKCCKILKFEIFLISLLILSSFASGFYKCHIFLHTIIWNANNCVSKSGFISFTWLHLLHLFSLHLLAFFTSFLTIAQLMMRILLWNFVCFLCVCSFVTYIPFLDDFWILVFISIYVLKNRWVLGVKVERLKNQR